MSVCRVPAEKEMLLVRTRTPVRELIQYLKTSDVFEDWVTVQITYNEDSNVIMTVTGGASQLRGSEPF